MKKEKFNLLNPLCYDDYYALMIAHWNVYALVSLLFRIFWSLLSTLKLEEWLKLWLQLQTKLPTQIFPSLFWFLHKKELKLKKHLIMQLHIVKHVSQNQFTMWAKTICKVTFKVEKILKDSLDLIQSPSHSNYERENLLGVWKQNIAWGCQQTFEDKTSSKLSLQ